MATRAAREKLQSQNDRHKEILAKMLAKEENKFCADCLSKGPRWVSWNLGIFVCIRCSGIHRSLGVHISKVKSVNLDTWTPDQMTSVCKRGNGWAKETFEARLPKDYPRPQNDSSMEYFIRDKYENKKYMSSTPIPLRSLEGLYDEEKGEPTKRISSNRNTNVSLPAAKNATPPAKLSPVPRRQTTTQLPKQQTSATVVDDLLGLESPVKQPSSTTTPASTAAEPTPPSADLTFDLFQSAPSVNPPPSSAFQTKTDTSTTTSSGGGKTVMSKDSILSLYSQNPTARQQTTTNNQQFINPTTNQFGGITQVHQTSGFPSTNPYNFQQQGGGVANTTTTGGMMYNQQQQFPQQQFQWQQQQPQQQPLHMQMGNMNMNGRGFPQQQQANLYQQQQQYHPQQQQQGFTPQQQMYGGFGGQQPQQFRPQSGASGWQQNGQTLSNHLWK